MLRSFLKKRRKKCLIFQIITVLSTALSSFASASSFEYRNYGENKCRMGAVTAQDWAIDLTAIISGSSFNNYKASGISKFENNTYKAEKIINLAVGRCLKMSEGEKSCEEIIDGIDSWRAKRYLIPKSPFESPDWWEESFHTNELMITILEALNIANIKLGKRVKSDSEMAKWLFEISHRTRKAELTKANQRTSWILTAAKTSILTNSKVNMGSSKKTAGELINSELALQFGMMKDDGALPEEAARGVRAVFYTGRQLGYLMALLEMGEKLGIGSYSQYESKLHKSVAFMLNAIDDVDVIYPYAKKMKASPKGDPRIQDYGIGDGGKWGTFSFMKVYASRFPMHPNVNRMLSHPQVGRFLSEDSLKIKGFGIDLGCLNPDVELAPAAVVAPIQSADNLEKKLLCFITNAQALGLKNLPTENEIKNLIEIVVSSNATKISKFALRRFGLQPQTIMEHELSLIRALQPEESSDKYCEQP